MDEISEALYTLDHIQVEKKFTIPYGSRKRYKYAEGDGWEILLLVWGIGSQTPIHDHNGSQGWIRMIEGSLVEKCYNHRPILQKETILSSGSDSYINDNIGTHQIFNPFETVAVSLHLYAPAIANCLIYDQKSNQWKNAQMAYDYQSVKEAKV